MQRLSIRGRRSRSRSSCRGAGEPTKRWMRGSFKVKLGAYFLLLAVRPLTAAFGGVGTVTKHAEERRVDARLTAELRAVLSSYRRRFVDVHAPARRVAARP